MADSTPAPENESGSGEKTRQLATPKEFSEIYSSLYRGISEALNTPANWAIVGVKRRGAALGRRMWNDLTEQHPSLSYGEVDISLYRDDYHLREGNPLVLGTEIPFAVDDASILLVDDVLFTGRTVRAAMDLILDFGRPKKIWLAVFVDRGHRELPISADFVGTTVSTQHQDHVMLCLKEVDGGEDGINLILGAVKE